MDHSYLCSNGSAMNYDGDDDFVSARNHSAVYASMGNCTSSSRSVRGYVNAAFMLLFFAIGLPCNALLIGIVLKKKLFTRPSSMLLLNLAVNHLLECFLIMPVTFLFGIGYDGIYRERQSICRLGVIFIWLGSVSIYTVALMSVDRVIYLKKPLTYGRIVTPRRMFFSIVVIWVFSTVISFAPLLRFGEVGYNHNLATCGIIVDEYGPYFLLLTALGVLAHLVKLFGFGYIIFIIRKHLLNKLRRSVGSIRGHRKRTNQDPANTNLEQRKGSFVQYKRSQLQLLKVFGAIFTVSLLAILPFAAAGILIPIFGDASAVPLLYTYHISYILVLSKSVIYPLLESYLIHETRAALFKFCSTCFCCCKRRKRTENVALPGVEPWNAAPNKTSDQQTSKEVEVSSL